MNEYTVEVITDPVVDGEWALVHNAMDDIPGTVLLADPDEPTLFFPVAAASPLKAVRMVDGLADLIGLGISAVKAYPTPEWDADLPREDEDPEPSSLVDGLAEWAENAPEPPAELKGHIAV